MAKETINKKGFKVLEISRSELIEKLARYGATGICDDCGQTSDRGYYIAVLNSWYCPKCFESWTERAVRYQEDIPYENRHFELYKHVFELQ